MANVMVKAGAKPLKGFPAMDASWHDGLDADKVPLSCRYYTDKLPLLRENSPPLVFPHLQLDPLVPGVNAAGQFDDTGTGREAGVPWAARVAS